MLYRAWMSLVQLLLLLNILLTDVRAALAKLKLYHPPSMAGQIYFVVMLRLMLQQMLSTQAGDKWKNLKEKMRLCVNILSSKRKLGG